MDDASTTRFWAKVDKTETCWLWVAGLASGGYGAFNYRGRMVRAHRYAYELMVGPIPTGLQLDHQCHIRRCVRPDHLKAVTPKQNSRNRAGASAVSQSGIRGVCWHSRDKRWIAQVGNTWCARFTSLEDAENAVIAKRAELFEP